MNFLFKLFRIFLTHRFVYWLFACILLVHHVFIRRLWAKFFSLNYRTFLPTMSCFSFHVLLLLLVGQLVFKRVDSVLVLAEGFVVGDHRSLQQFIKHSLLTLCSAGLVHLSPRLLSWLLIWAQILRIHILVNLIHPSNRQLKWNLSTVQVGSYCLEFCMHLLNLARRRLYFGRL